MSIKRIISTGSNTTTISSFFNSGDSELFTTTLKASVDPSNQTTQYSDHTQSTIAMHDQHESWDREQIGDFMALHGNRVTFIGAREGQYLEERGNTAFLSEVVDCGVHHWSFRTKLKFTHWWSATIGIWNCSNGTPPRNNIYTLGGSQGYGFNLSEGSLLDEVTGNVPTHTAVSYGQRCIGTNCIEMILDFNKLELRFIIDGKDYGKAFTVKKGSYRAAVNLSQKRDFVEFVSYKKGSE